MTGSDYSNTRPWLGMIPTLAKTTEQVPGTMKTSRSKYRAAGTLQDQQPHLYASQHWARHYEEDYHPLLEGQPDITDPVSARIARSIPSHPRGNFAELAVPCPSTPPFGQLHGFQTLNEPSQKGPTQRHDTKKRAHVEEVEGDGDALQMWNSRRWSAKSCMNHWLPIHLILCGGIFALCATFRLDSP